MSYDVAYNCACDLVHITWWAMTTRPWVPSSFLLTTIISNIYPALLPPPDPSSDEDKSEGDATPTIYEAAVALYQETHCQAGYTLCPPLSDELIAIMPPTIQKALLEDEDINIIIKTLNRNPSYNPTIQFNTVMAALFPLWLQLEG
jgi:hypothetical protein